MPATAVLGNSPVLVGGGVGLVAADGAAGGLGVGGAADGGGLRGGASFGSGWSGSFGAPFGGAGNFGSSVRCFATEARTLSRDACSEAILPSWSLIQRSTAERSAASGGVSASRRALASLVAAS